LKDYEVTDGIRCHVFLDAGSYDELLSAIAKWWASNQEDAKTMEAITFTVDDDGISALVHWNYLSPEMKEKVDRVLTVLHPIPPVEPDSISGN